MAVDGHLSDTNDREADLGSYDRIWTRSEAGAVIQEKIDGARLRSKRRSARLQDGSAGALVVVTRGPDGRIVSVLPST